ncbi:MAG: nucleotidyltransferase domain-containing protein [Euzebyales bacterium]|nr:nucleotidyltransferase domain-containing protein [Euzebyales bacterium]
MSRHDRGVHERAAAEEIGRAGEVCASGRRCARLRSRHKPQVSFCCLFGSVATASAHPGSDVDLAVALTVPIGR